MTRALVALALAFVVLGAPHPRGQTPFEPLDLVGTWTLARVQQGVDGGAPATAVPNPRGLLVFDRAGHMVEVVTRAAMPAASDPRGRFQGFGGFWGRYRVDGGQALVLTPAGGVSPNVAGSEMRRTFELTGDALTITSSPGEPHVQGATRWTWERVPAVENLSPGYRQVVGFWEHVVEQRINGTTNEVLSETTRAPSVIAYTPSGYVGVHFPPRNRPRFAGAEPTDAEARAALMGYIGYFGALAVYPGMIFHHIMGGLSPATGTTLKRTYELKGNELTIRFAPTFNPDGPDRTIVRLRRLSGEQEMAGRGR